MSSKLEFTMKSGATVTVNVETFTLGGTSLEWTTPDRRRSTRRLLTVDLDAVDAIVEITA